MILLIRFIILAIIVGIIIWSIAKLWFKFVIPESKEKEIQKQRAKENKATRFLKKYNSSFTNKIKEFLSYFKDLNVLDLRHHPALVGKYNIINDYIFYFDGHEVFSNNFWVLKYKNESGRNIFVFPDPANNSYPIICTKIINKNSQSVDIIKKYILKYKGNSTFLGKSYEFLDLFQSKMFKIHISKSDIEELLYKNNFYGNFIIVVSDNDELTTSNLFTATLNYNPYFCGICFNL